MTFVVDLTLSDDDEGPQPLPRRGMCAEASGGRGRGVDSGGGGHVHNVPRCGGLPP